MIGVQGDIVLGMLVAALLAVLMRLAIGPGLADRVVVLDLMATLVMGVLATFAIINDRAVLIDVAIVVALVTFLGIVGFARYLEKRAAERGGMGND